MPAQSIAITVTPDTKAGLRALEPDEMMRTIKRGVDQGMEMIVARVREQRFTSRGKGSLGVVTGNARRSLRAPPSSIEGNAVIADMGSNLAYVQAHEFGFSGRVNVKEHTRRGHSRVSSAFAVGAVDHFTGRVNSKKQKRTEVRAGIVRAHTRQLNIPEKRMIRDGAKDNQKQIDTGLSIAIRESMGH